MLATARTRLSLSRRTRLSLSPRLARPADGSSQGAYACRKRRCRHAISTSQCPTRCSLPKQPLAGREHAFMARTALSLCCRAVAGIA
eukprot:3449305-Rhodomonas_salina.2